MSSSKRDAKDVDLSMAAHEIICKSGNAGGLTGQLMKWLAREGIDEAEFNYFLKHTSNLAISNDKGLQLCKSLENSDAEMKSRMHVASLKLKAPVNVGRWMSYGPELYTQVTTVAALLTHHRASYAAEAVCNLVCDSEGLPGEAEKDRLLPIAEKVAESIANDVVNCGHNFGHLEKFGDTCRHVVDVHTFAEVVKAVCGATGNIVIHSKKFLADVYMWLWTHVDGKVSVSIAGRPIHSEQVGRLGRAVEMLVDEDCSKENSRHRGKRDRITVSSVGDGSDEILLDISSSPCTSHPNIRQPFYDLEEHCRGPTDGMLARDTLLEISILGQRIVKWIMDRPLRANAHTEIAYAACLSQDDNTILHPTPVTVGHLLKKQPSICNADFGTSTISATFNPPDDADDHTQMDWEADFKILKCFPQSKEIIDRMRKECWCHECRHGKARELGEDPQCLCSLARDRLWLIIAHSIAEGFGAPDASNLGNFAAVRTGSRELMFRLIYHKIVSWDVWFSLAARTYMGCPFALSDVHTDGTLKELAVVQFGSAVVVAPWLDLDTDFELQDSFSMRMVEGQVRGMETKFGVAHVEVSAGSGMGQIDLHDPGVLTNEHYSPDNAGLEVHSAVIGVAGSPYRLVLSVESPNYFRSVNPSVAFMALARSAEPICDHAQDGEQVAAPSPSYRTWPAEKAFGFWDGENFTYISDSTDEESGSQESGSLQQLLSYWGYSTEILNTPMIRNILLSLSPFGCVLKNDRCCFACAEGLADAPPRYEPARRILCVATKGKTTTASLRQE